jgi:hypothetical protein
MLVADTKSGTKVATIAYINSGHTEVCCVAISLE